MHAEEIKIINGNHYQQLYANKLESLEEMHSLQGIHNFPKLNY